jgi:hypothetical protein
MTDEYNGVSCDGQEGFNEPLKNIPQSLQQLKTTLGASKVKNLMTYKCVSCREDTKNSGHIHTQVYVDTCLRLCILSSKRVKMISY